MNSKYKSLHFHLQVPKDPAKFVDSFLKRVVPSRDLLKGDGKHDGESTVNPKTTMMDMAYKYQNKGKMSWKRKKSHKKDLSVAQKKKMNLYEIPAEHQK